MPSINLQFDRFFLYLIDLRNNAKEEKLRMLLGNKKARKSRRCYSSKSETITHLEMLSHLKNMFDLEIHFYQIQLARRGDSSVTRWAKPSSPPPTLRERKLFLFIQSNLTSSSTTALTLVHFVTVPTSSWAHWPSIWTQTTPSPMLLAISAPNAKSPSSQSFSSQGMARLASRIALLTTTYVMINILYTYDKIGLCPSWFVKIWRSRLYDGCLTYDKIGLCPSWFVKIWRSRLYDSCLTYDKIGLCPSFALPNWRVNKSK